MAETKVIVIPDGKICDYIDGKFRNDTPEEYVRQTIEKRLVNEHKYLTSQIKIEFTLQVGSRKPRADIVIWDKDALEQTQGTIKIIIECKKETASTAGAIQNPLVNTRIYHLHDHLHNISGRKKLAPVAAEICSYNFFIGFPLDVNIRAEQAVPLQFTDNIC